jgi:predicted DNA-binding protein with PD1-like motif
MKSARFTPVTYVLRFDPGDDIHKEIEGFCQSRSIRNAGVTGIGSVERVILAHYSIHTKQFSKREFGDIYELTSMLGNVAVIEGTSQVHLHVTLAGPDMGVWGGHLIKGYCSATLEVILTSYPTAHVKTHSDVIGLNVWDFDEPTSI